MKKFLVVTATFLIAIISGLIYLYNYFYVIEVEIKNPTENQLIIKKGDSVDTVLTKLNLDNKILSKIYLKLMKLDNQLKAGNYNFENNHTRYEIFQKLVKGEYKTVKVTIPEGFTLKQIENRLIDKGLIKKDEFETALKEKNNFPYYVPNGNYEGYFFPDTYFFRENSSEKEIIDKILDNFILKVKNNLDIEDISSKDLYNKLILASIIEKEAYYDREKPKISSVFHNRMNRGMRLESCATIEYLFDYKKQRILYSDLEIESDYNTYIYKGLPPTPISNPGIEAIKAAITPEKTDYLYFRVKENKEHFFSNTYKKHLNFKY